MAKRTKYNIGDVFNIQLNDNNWGYGRIIKVDKNLVFIELYKVDTLKKYRIEELAGAEVILSIWSSNKALLNSSWNILGNIPVSENYSMPNFYTRSGFTGKLLLIPGTETYELPRNCIEITEEEIGDAQPSGIFGDIAVKNVYFDKLEKLW